MEYIYSYSGFLHFHPIPSLSASYEHMWNHLCRLHTFMEISVEDRVISLTFFSVDSDSTQKVDVGSASNMVWLHRAA